MENQKILQEVIRRSKADPWCQECLSHINRHEEAFSATRDKLTDAEQEQLDLYIGACEAWCDAHIFVAYQLGSEHCFQIL